jgi:anti-anti-sigma factor
MTDHLDWLRRHPPAADSPEDPGLAMDLDERGGFLLVTVHGVIDFWSVEPLREQLDAALRREPPQLVLDLNDVSFVDSTGLGLLLSLHRGAAAGGGWLHLARPRPQLHRLLRTTALDSYFHLYPTVDAAAPPS